MQAFLIDPTIFKGFVQAGLPPFKNGAHIYPEAEVRGYRAIEARVSEAYEEFVRKGGFVFKLSNAAQSHHNLVKVNWEMVPAGGGEVAAVGSDCFVLSDDGRIRFDYQF